MVPKQSIDYFPGLLCGFALGLLSKQRDNSGTLQLPNRLSVLNQWSIESLGSNSSTLGPSPLSLIMVSTVLVFKADKGSHFILSDLCRLVSRIFHCKKQTNSILSIHRGLQDAIMIKVKLKHFIVHCQFSTLF